MDELLEQYKKQIQELMKQNRELLQRNKELIEQNNLLNEQLEKFKIRVEHESADKKAFVLRWLQYYLPK